MYENERKKASGTAVIITRKIMYESSGPCDFRKKGY